MSRFLWFYSTDGTLLKKHEITPVNTTKYSQNGEFVVAFGGLDNPLFYVFTKTGDIFYQGKYTDIIQDEEGTMLYGVFVSEHGDMMLLQTWREIQLWLTNGSILWKKSSFRADDCFFISQKNLIIATIYTGFLQDSNLVDSYTMQVLSLETGNVLDEIKEISKITVIDEHIFVTKDGKYYEYQIR